MRYKDRRRAQAGTTLVELLVATTIMGIALALIIGTFSTGLLDATIAKRNVAGQAVIQAELDRITASTFNSSPLSYSDCYKTESSAPPVPASAFLGACPDSTYSLRADVSVTPLTPTATTQTWTVAVTTWPDGVPVGSNVSTIKSDR